MNSSDLIPKQFHVIIDYLVKNVPNINSPAEAVQTALFYSLYTLKIPTVCNHTIVDILREHMGKEGLSIESEYARYINFLKKFKQGELDPVWLEPPDERFTLHSERVKEKNKE